MIEQQPYTGTHIPEGVSEFALQYFVCDGDRGHLAKHPFCSLSYKISLSADKTSPEDKTFNEILTERVKNRVPHFLMEVELPNREVFWRPVKKSAKKGIYASDKVFIVWVYLYVDKAQYDKIEEFSKHYQDIYLPSQQEEFDCIARKIQDDILRTGCFNPIHAIFS